MLDQSPGLRLGPPVPGILDLPEWGGGISPLYSSILSSPLLVAYDREDRYVLYRKLAASDAARSIAMLARGCRNTSYAQDHAGLIQ